MSLYRLLQTSSPLEADYAKYPHIVLTSNLEQSDVSLATSGSGCRVEQALKELFGYTDSTYTGARPTKTPRGVILGPGDGARNPSSNELPTHPRQLLVPNTGTNVDFCVREC